MSSFLASLTEQKLQWFPELGIGWYPVTEAPYDRDYWLRYRRMDQTPTGAELTRRRLDLVTTYWEGPVVDIGIGGGRFVESDPQFVGYDVNPDAVEWLQQNHRWLDPTQNKCLAATFWDSLEHIHDPTAILSNVGRFVFISTPIYRGPDHILKSKHYRQDEHCWYFTREGLDLFMRCQGFKCLEYNTMEQPCGREDIGTFVFVRSDR